MIEIGISTMAIIPISRKRAGEIVSCPRRCNACSARVLLTIAASKKNLIEKVRKSKPKRKTYTAPALEKGLDVLELLSSNPAGLSLNGISSRLNRSVGEIFRMVVVLEQRGYVGRVPDSDLYMLTAKMFSVSHRYASFQQVTVVAGPIMRALSQVTRQSCHLVIYHDGRGVIVNQQDGPTDRCLNVRLGATASLTDTCSGRVLLAFSDFEKRKSMLAERPKHLRTRFRKAELDDILEGIRSRGYERVNSAQIQGVIDIGFPVFDWTERVRAALIIPYLTRMDGTNPMDIAATTQCASDAAGEISALLESRQNGSDQLG